MVAAHLVRMSAAPLRLALIDPSPHPSKGAAYSTPHPEHWLNVRADQMGAFPEAPDGFWRWLNGRATPHQFAPRPWYGAYLDSIHAETLQLASRQQSTLVPIRAQVNHIAHIPHGYRLEISDHPPVEAAQLLLATGNQLSPDDTPGIVHTPWRFDYRQLPQNTTLPIWIIGSGLTATDTVLSLRRAGFLGPMHMLSRHGTLPHSHLPQPSAPLSLSCDLLGNLPLSQAMHRWRCWAREQQTQGASWQAAIDALRPHTLSLWQALSPPDRARFMRHLWSHWNRHRHRMAPEIAGEMVELRTSGQLQLHKGAAIALSQGIVRWRNAQHQEKTSAAALIFDCRGPRYTLEAMPWLNGLLAGNILQPADLRLGLHTYAPYRVSAEGYPPLYAMGTLLLGERLETTAVPELRVQAREVAQQLLASAR